MLGFQKHQGKDKNKDFKIKQLFSQSYIFFIIKTLNNAKANYTGYESETKYASVSPVAKRGFPDGLCNK